MTAAPFGRSQRLYDAVYSWKDYAAEAERLQPHLRGTSILDVACGTGGHIPHLRGAYEVVGVDIDPGMLDIAREKLQLRVLAAAFSVEEQLVHDEQLGLAADRGNVGIGRLAEGFALVEELRAPG